MPVSRLHKPSSRRGPAARRGILAGMRLITAREVPASLARVHEPVDPPVRVGLVQHAWDEDAGRLRSTLREGIATAADAGARVVFLPELTKEGPKAFNAELTASLWTNVIDSPDVEGEFKFGLFATRPGGGAARAPCGPRPGGGGGCPRGCGVPAPPPPPRGWSPSRGVTAARLGSGPSPSGGRRAAADEPAQRSSMLPSSLPRAL